MDDYPILLSYGRGQSVTFGIFSTIEIGSPEAFLREVASGYAFDYYEPRSSGWKRAFFGGATQHGNMLLLGAVDYGYRYQDLTGVLALLSTASYSEVPLVIGDALEGREGLAGFQLIDLRPHEFNIEFGNLGRTYYAVVECSLINVDEMLAEWDGTSIDVVLHRYFQQIDKESHVGAAHGGVATLSGREYAAESFRSSPPSVPGFTFQLIEVLTKSEWLESHRIPEQKSPPIGESVPNEVPVWIWVSGDDGTEVRGALLDYFSDEVFAIAGEWPPETGSWMQRLKVSFLNAWRSEFVQDHYDELNRRLQMEIIEKTAADVDNKRAESAAKLIAAVEKQDSAIVIFGQMIIVRHDERMIVRLIDAVTAGKIEAHRSLKTNPEAILRFLDGAPLDVPPESAVPAPLRAPISDQAQLDDRGYL